MTDSALWLSLTQFYLSVGFMALFAMVELGLSWVLFYFKVRGLLADGVVWANAYRFWSRVFALSFFFVLAGSIPVLVQLGSLWPHLMARIGDVAGPLLAAAVVTVFIFKSCFLGAMLFGQRYVSDRIHTLIVFMTAVGVTLSGLWLLSLASWVQTPAGARLIDGQYYVDNWRLVVMNPSMPWYAAQFILLAALTVAFVMLGVAAGQSLRQPLDASQLGVFKTALFMAVAGVVLQAGAGVGLQKALSHHQPARMAATDAYWHSGKSADLVLFAWPDQAKSQNRASLVWRGKGGQWLDRDKKGQYLGLDRFSGMVPPVAVTFWSFRLLLLVGLAMAIAGWRTLWRVRRKGYDPGVLSRRWRRGLVAMTFSGWAACALALAYAMFGMYPFIVNGTITLREVMGSVPDGTLAAALAVQLLFCGVLLWGFCALLSHAARYGVVPVARRRGRA
jgi:cytochrome d ubiquinol oxidase subunit I